MSKRRIKTESFENVKRVVDYNKDNISTVGEMDLVTKDAYDNSIDNSAHVEEVVTELNSKAEEITLDNPDTGKEIKTPYTKKLTLDESIEDFNIDKLNKEDEADVTYLDFDMFDFVYNLVSSQPPVSPINPFKKRGAHKFQSSIGHDRYLTGDNKGHSEIDDEGNPVWVPETTGGGSQVGVTPDGNIIVEGNAESDFDDAIQVLDYYEIEHSDVKKSNNKLSQWKFYMTIKVPMVSSGIPMIVEDYLEDIGMTLEEAMPAWWVKTYRTRQQKEEKERQQMINDRQVQKMVNKAITDAANNDEDFEVLLMKLFDDLTAAGLKYSKKEVRDKFMSEFI